MLGQVGVVAARTRVPRQRYPPMVAKGLRVSSTLLRDAQVAGSLVDRVVDRFMRDRHLR